MRAIEVLQNPPPALAQLLPKALQPPNAAPSIQLIDVRSVNPIPHAAIADAVKKTGRLVIVQEAGKSGSVATNIAGEVATRAFEHLEAPIGIVSGWE